MFGAVPPSAEEVALQEEDARRTLKMAMILSAMLYVSPFIVDYVSTLL